ncbi:MAG: hypothetical protein PWQ57_767 [Desulfovibrionales bacterium]|nr:hypothetical protein [Desulfovibrionales bacterium]
MATNVLVEGVAFFPGRSIHTTKRKFDFTDLQITQAFKHTMKYLSALFSLALLILFCSPSEAWAWGPGVHMVVGGKLLSNLHLLSPFLADLLSKRPNAFLYGCLSADIFIGKGVKAKAGHSHNWSVGFDLLASARDDKVRAFAYGYLSHLAADIVAHNFYVPNLLFTTPTAGKFSHVYIEMQADRLVPWDRKLVLNLLRQPNRAADQCLLSVMSKKRWPFRIKKRLVRSGLSVAKRKAFHNSLLMAQRALPIQDPDGYLLNMVDLTAKVVVNFLQDPKSSPALNFDPIGAKRLDQVRRLRRAGGAGSFRAKPRFFSDDQPLACLPDIHWL